jgi:hypothetical protein
MINPAKFGALKWVLLNYRQKELYVFDFLSTNKYSVVFFTILVLNGEWLVSLAVEEEQLIENCICVPTPN